MLAPPSLPVTVCAQPELKEALDKRLQHHNMEPKELGFLGDVARPLP
jgi:hypothetical protein